VSPWQIALTILAALVIAAGAIYDLKSFRIPNQIILALIGLALVNALLAGTPSAIGWRGALVIFAVGVFLWKAKLVGAGDVKFASGIALWFPGQIPGFLILTSLLGALFALIILVKSKLKKEKPGKIPYGVPMALASIILFSLILISI
jgi:Flp pilus assembly protein protease CpaA